LVVQPERDHPVEESALNLGLVAGGFGATYLRDFARVFLQIGDSDALATDDRGGADLVRIARGEGNSENGAGRDSGDATAEQHDRSFSKVAADHAESYGTTSVDHARVG
jgi:hypothetical protein